MFQPLTTTKDTKITKVFEFLLFFVFFMHFVVGKMFWQSELIPFFNQVLVSARQVMNVW